MKAEEARFMWIFVFFDLPVRSKTQRRHATRFRKFLIDDGFIMIQYSVYARICRGEDAVDKHMTRITRNMPKEGHIRGLQVTDKQYGRMRLFLGQMEKNEQKKAQQLVLL
jgi:CRISPR-associated protein Cas2